VMSMDGDVMLYQYGIATFVGGVLRHTCEKVFCSEFNLPCR
jgi:hypothetical protein